MPGSDQPSPDDATEWLTDVLYTALGLGVLAVNRIQVARRDLQANAAAPDAAAALEELRALLADPERRERLLTKFRDQFEDVDDRLGGIENRIGSILDDLEQELPDSSRGLTATLRNIADDHIVQFRSVLGLKVR